MELPVLNGTIDRRILINYRVKPEVVKLLLPPHLDPLVINGYASAGICLLRLKDIGMKYSPSFMRITSENAAHRFLVKYKDGDQEAHGVYIPRRDTDSMLNVILAGNIFSWPHYAASFKVAQGDGNYAVTMRSKDGHTSLHVETQLTNAFPEDSMFDSMNHASDCFRCCAFGISPSTRPKKFKTIELKTKSWAVKPLLVRALKSTFYEETTLFPEGTIQFDNALLMEGIEHAWLSHSV